MWGTKFFLLSIMCTMYRKVWLCRMCILCLFDLLKKCQFFYIVFLRNKVFFKHDFTKTRVLRYSWHQLCAKCTKMCIHAECVYFFYLTYSTTLIFKNVVLKKNRSWDFLKQGVLIYSSYELCVQHIKMCNDVESYNFVYSI